MRAGCKTVIDAVKAANPTLIAHTYDHRPDGLTGKTPCVFVDVGINQPSISHDWQIRFRTVTAFVHIVNKAVTNQQAAHEQDVLVDLIVDAFTDSPRAASTGAVIQPTGVDSHVEPDGTANYACSVLIVTANLQEPRSSQP